jgi:hypothetical protein
MKCSSLKGQFLCQLPFLVSCAYLQDVSEYRAKTFWSKNLRDEIFHILINADYLQVKLL